MVSATHSAAFEEPGVNELGHDPLGGSFGDPHPLGDVTEANAGVACDAEQDLRVVRDERPAAGL